MKIDKNDPLGLLGGKASSNDDPLGLLGDQSTKQSIGTPDYSQAAASFGPQEELTFGGALKQGISNIPSSAMEYVNSIVLPFTQPKETAEGIGKLAMGLVEKISGQPMGPGHEEYVNAVGQHLLDTYGGWDNIKKTIATNPVQLLGDVSTVLTGGGAVTKGIGTIGKLGKVAKTGELISQAGDITNPMGIPGRAANMLREQTIARTGVPEMLYEKSMKIPPGSVNEATRERILNTLVREEGIPLNKKAVPKMTAIAQEMDESIKAELNQLTSRMRQVSQISVDDITTALDKLKAKYRNRSNPQEYYDIIDAVKDQYVNHAFAKGNINAQLKTASGQTKNYQTGGMIDIDKAHELKQGIYQEIQEFYRQREKPETGRIGIQNKIEAGAKAEAARVIRNSILEHPDVPKSVKEKLAREAGLRDARKWVERAVNRGSNIDLGTLSTGVFGMLMGAGLKAAIAYRVAISQPIQTRVAIGLAKGSHIAKWTGSITKPVSIGAYQAGRFGGETIEEGAE